ncbi:hypothetical protein K439DRAFT_1621870 [Ramaria rubella]|nr:hypothetical protein K439DRAFT_1621870 [Ramaria rubella]
MLAAHTSCSLELQGAQPATPPSLFPHYPSHYPLPSCYSQYSQSEQSCTFQGYFCMFLPIACSYTLPEHSVALQPYCQALIPSKLLVVAKAEMLTIFLGWFFMQIISRFWLILLIFTNEERAREREQRQMTSTTNRCERAAAATATCTSLPLPLIHFLTLLCNNLRGILVIHLSSLLWLVLPIFQIPSLLIQVLGIKWLIYVLS